MSSPPPSRMDPTLRPRRPLIAGNWKMHLNGSEAEALARAVIAGLPAQGPEVLVAPSFPLLPAVARLARGSCLGVAAQDMHWEASGAFTGAVSPAQVKDAGAARVILGHSERRRLFGDTDAVVRRKLESALRHGLGPVLCVGETLEERESGRAFQVIAAQLRSALEGLAPGDLASLVVAYEPVWAIGTGRNASPQQAEEAHRCVRESAAGLCGEGFARGLRVLYGGSVTPDNVDGLMARPGVDGALVGGASLQPGSFLRIVRFQAAEDIHGSTPRVG